MVWPIGLFKTGQLPGLAEATGCADRIRSGAKALEASRWRSFGDLVRGADPSRHSVGRDRGRPRASEWIRALPGSIWPEYPGMSPHPKRRPERMIKKAVFLDEARSAGADQLKTRDGLSRIVGSIWTREDHARK